MKWVGDYVKWGKRCSCMYYYLLYAVRELNAVSK